MSFVSIEEVAERNELRLFRTSRYGQWKAHCPVCGDRRDQFHLYVKGGDEKETGFYCHKCGAHGGTIAFHAWLRGITFEAAKDELYPPKPELPNRPKRKRHPAETLTREQLASIGFTSRTYLKRPVGMDEKAWYRYKRDTLEFIWREWNYYQQIQREREEFWRAFEAAEQANAMCL